MEQESYEKQEKNDTEYFETYELKENDIKTLSAGVDLIDSSNLFERGVRDILRYVTYDSYNYYVVTRGEHGSTEEYSVEELPFPGTTDYHMFKIPHAGNVGSKRRDYIGAHAWLLTDELEHTAPESAKFPNETVLYQEYMPNVPQPDKILDVISLPPQEPYHKIQQGAYNYLTDVMFHEVGHIEHRRLLNWQHGEAALEAFPSTKQREKLETVIHRSNLLPKWLTNLLLQHTDKGAVSEMYAMMIDREAEQKHDPKRYKQENEQFDRWRTKLTQELDPDLDSDLTHELTKSGHFAGRLLVRILEEQLPDFTERKEFVRSIQKRDERRYPNQ